jgi:hypothetical protein
VTLYARAWVWHIFATVLFLYSMGDDASWMYIPTILEWNEASTYSWGSTVLAYLYRQLCHACQHRAQNPGLGGLHLPPARKFDNPYILFGSLTFKQ